MNPNSSEAQTEKNGKRSKKHDLFLVLAVLAAAALLFAGRKLFFSSSPAAVTVSVDGTELMTLDLNQDGEQIIESPGGGTNRLVIKDGGSVLPGQGLHKAGNDFQDRAVHCLPPKPGNCNYHWN